MTKSNELSYKVSSTSNFSMDEITQDISKRFFETYRLKKSVSTAPSYIPKNFYEQIVFYDDGANKRIYLYVNNNWLYASLT